MKKINSVSYFAAAALVSVLMLVIYASVQQTYRTGLNDPQIQMARDISTKLEEGKSFNSLVASDSINIEKSLSPFVVLYDANGNAIQSNGFLDGKFPQVPKSLFDNVKENGECTVSWQPRRGIRMAMAIVKTNTSPVQFVAAGRSMTEVENRIQQMRTMISIAWIVCVAIILITAMLNNFIIAKRILQKTN